jgi:hypothetical protein
MLALSDQQLDVVRTAAHQLPRSLRSAFLQRLAALLDGREFGDGHTRTGLAAWLLLKAGRMPAFLSFTLRASCMPAVTCFGPIARRRKR